MKKLILLLLVLFSYDNFAQENEVSLSNNDDLKSSVEVNTISFKSINNYG